MEEVLISANGNGDEFNRRILVQDHATIEQLCVEEQQFSVEQEQEADAYDAVEAEIEPSVTKQEKDQVRYEEKFDVNIQSIDDSAIIEPSPIANKKFDLNSNDTERNVNRIETEGKKVKKHKRRGGKARKNRELYLNCFPLEKKEKKGFVYSRDELEALRFKDLVEQKKKWVEVYCGMCPEVAEEYDGLSKYDTRCKEDSVNSVDFDPRAQFQNASTGPKDLGDDCHIDQLNSVNNDEIGDFIADFDSDDDYSSIQKPAFMVTGEPDFDSGPPQDGLEYLRRVRWEATHIPDVAVAKVDKSKLKREQTVYMPQLPDIAECPQNLLPNKQWEDSFLDDFSELRRGLSCFDLQGSTSKDSFNSQSVQEQDIPGQISESVFQNFNLLTSNENSCTLETSSAKCESNIQEKLSLTNDLPTLSTILEMDSAARSSMLKRRIRSIENMTSIPQNDCLWLFVLCASIDCPLDADTSAALRSLLRKCAKLRSEKETLDDEVVMLNILATISGRYFGQLER